MALNNVIKTCKNSNFPLGYHIVDPDPELVKLKIKEGCDKPYFVEADRERIRQVLDNLVNNAIKYGNEKGYVQIGFYDMDTNLLIEVSDNGIGISNEHLPRLFERFYRVDKARSREEGGTGLGLSIVKHIIEAHGAEIAFPTLHRHAQPQ